MQPLTIEWDWIGLDLRLTLLKAFCYFCISLISQILISCCCIANVPISGTMDNGPSSITPPLAENGHHPKLSQTKPTITNKGSNLSALFELCHLNTFVQDFSPENWTLFLQLEHFYPFRPNLYSLFTQRSGNCTYKRRVLICNSCKWCLTQ